MLFRSSVALKDTVKPPNWKKDLCNLDTDPDNNGYKNEDLIVWMRTAALPNFRKLYRRIDHSQSSYENGLPAGNYSFEIEYSKLSSIFRLIKQPAISCLAPACLVIGLIDMLLIVWLAFT